MPKAVEIADPILTINEIGQNYRKALNVERAAGFSAQFLFMVASLQLNSLAQARTDLPPLVYLPAIAVLLVGATILNVKALKSDYKEVYDEANREFDKMNSLLKTDGITLEDNQPEDEALKYQMARKVRYTKLLLARKGKLDYYQPGVWIESTKIRVPNFLKPRQEEVDEIDQWVDEKREKEVNFVADLAQAETIEVVASKTDFGFIRQVRLQDPETYRPRTMPLGDIMTLWGATGESRTKEDLASAWRLKLPDFTQDSDFDLDKTGQELADFFEKPVTYFSGRRLLYDEIDVYGTGVKNQVFSEFRRAIYRNDFAPRVPDLRVT